MKSAALLTGVLVLSLAACGGSRDDEALPGSSSSPTAAPSSSSAPASPVPTASPSSAPTAQECPIKATAGSPPAGVSADLAVKPVIAANPAPPPSTVTVADVVVGTGDEAATLSQVEVKYVGALYTDGTEFDSSWSRSPDETLPFAVCSTGTIPGFAISPTGMKVGGRRVVTIPAELGYGAEGSPPTIPANAPLVFVIDLVKVTPPAS